MEKFLESYQPLSPSKVYSDTTVDTPKLSISRPKQAVLEYVPAPNSPFTPRYV